MRSAMIALGFAPAYWLMLGLVALAGIGNREPDGVGRSRLARARLRHPHLRRQRRVRARAATMIALTALLGWRGALSAAGLVAFVVLGAMLACCSTSASRASCSCCSHRSWSPRRAWSCWLRRDRRPGGDDASREAVRRVEPAARRPLASCDRHPELAADHHAPGACAGG
jgi:hypothetical protein